MSVVPLTTIASVLINSNQLSHFLFLLAVDVGMC